MSIKIEVTLTEAQAHGLKCQLRLREQPHDDAAVATFALAECNRAIDGTCQAARDRALTLAHHLPGAQPQLMGAMDAAIDEHLAAVETAREEQARRDREAEAAQQAQSEDGKVE